MTQGEAVREEQLILVDENDREIGIAGKQSTHRQGLLHRAISVLITDAKGRWLLQRRAMAKYHSGRLWTNACCSHPRPGEPPMAAAERRLVEEMGFATDLTFVSTVRYRSPLDRGMIENELVHVFRGTYSGAVMPNPDEVEGFDWVFEDELVADIKAKPDQYTVWFKKYAAELPGLIRAA